MATTYQLADPEVTDALRAVMAAYHPELAEADVRVGVLMASNQDGDAVKHGGYPALACVKVVSLKDRVSKGYDAEMLIDQSEWNQLTDAHRDAVLDHELSHLILVPAGQDDDDSVAADGKPLGWKLDDLGRPKLKVRLADWNSGDGFEAVVQRHGVFAVEYLNLSKAKARADAAKSSGESA